MREARAELLGFRLQCALQERKRDCWIVSVLKQLKVFALDHAMLHQSLKIDDLVPVAGAIENHRNRSLQFASLRQSQDFGELVQSAKAAGKNYQRARQVREPELAHEEITKLKRQVVRHIDIWVLFMRQTDIEADCSSACVDSAAVGGFHDPAPAA